MSGGAEILFAVAAHRRRETTHQHFAAARDARGMELRLRHQGCGCGCERGRRSRRGLLTRARPLAAASPSERRRGQLSPTSVQHVACASEELSRTRQHSAGGLDVLLACFGAVTLRTAFPVFACTRSIHPRRCACTSAAGFRVLLSTPHVATFAILWMKT